MGEWRTIEKELLDEVLKLVENATMLTGEEKTLDLSEDTLKALVADLRECVDGCDHSVGICMCSEVGVLEELERRSRGKMTCPKCHGDGFTWREAHEDGTCDRLRAEGYDCNDGHFESCDIEVDFKKEVRV